MNREDIQKLLGGYATGTLTPEEEQALFAAALADQELFDALGREQVLRDLLRDPAAKANLLAALDAPAAGGFWAWLRRPVVAGFAVAGVTAIASVAVWQATRVRPSATVAIAELKMQEPAVRQAAPVVVPAPAPAAKAKRQEAAVPTTPLAPSNDKVKELAETAPMRDARADEKRAEPMKDVATVANAPVPAAVPAPPPPPPPAAAVPPPRTANTAESVEATAAAPSPQNVQAQAAALEAALSKATAADKLTVDARSLFYGNSFVRSGAMSAGASGGALTAPQASSTSVRVANGTVVKKEAAGVTSILGVRVSVLRGGEETTIGTLLDPGESVRLRVTPNTDGFLYVAAREGNNWKMLASGPATRLKPFETPPLPFVGSGQRQVYVMLSRSSQTLAPRSLASLARSNMVQTPAEQDRATYVIAQLQNEAPQQVVQAITLTYR
jgi:hypothetical protein